jgi:hypothetical protein
MVVREEIELVQEVTDVNATQRVHLREGQNAGKSASVRIWAKWREIEHTQVLLLVYLV